MNELICSRRTCLSRLLQMGVGLSTVSLIGCEKTPAQSSSLAPSTTIVTVVPFNEQGNPLSAIYVNKIIKNDEDWKKQLSELAFTVTRKNGTEAAFSGLYWHHKAKGLYLCACCNLALCNSNSKYDSGTGWPSFWQMIAKENVQEHADHSFGLQRIAVSCSQCDAHLGHVFRDGPQPTGLRYCLNSVALKFQSFRI